MWKHVIQVIQILVFSKGLLDPQWCNLTMKSSDSGDSIRIDCMKLRKEEEFICTCCFPTWWCLSPFHPATFIICRGKHCSFQKQLSRHFKLRKWCGGKCSPGSPIKCLACPALSIWSQLYPISPNLLYAVTLHGWGSHHKSPNITYSLVFTSLKHHSIFLRFPLCILFWFFSCHIPIMSPFHSLQQLSFLPPFLVIAIPLIIFSTFSAYPSLRQPAVSPVSHILSL